MLTESLRRNATLRCAVGFALKVVIGSTLVTTANAQSATSAQSSGRVVETIVVTGSYIRGSSESTALPVDIVTAEDLESQGSPTIVQLIKTMPAMSGGAIGESNRFIGNGAGNATVNLRGFGAQRTMVLMNGRRLAPSPIGTNDGIDVNLVPMAAIGSIEVLKDGAAATYGSDAVAGVVNFLTRRDLDGFEVNANYSHIDNSDGDYDTSLAWGSKSERGNVLVTAGFRRRSELRTTEVDWAIRRGAEGLAANPTGGWSAASNPGTYTTGTAAQLASGTFPAASSFVDDGCTDLGGLLIGTTGCRFQFTNFDNLVSDEYHYQLFGEANYDINDAVEMHAELMLARHDTPDERVSPAQSTVQFPTPVNASGGSPGGGTSPYPATGLNQQSRYYIPLANPGLTAFRNAHCGAPTGTFVTLCPQLANGVITSQTGWRPIGYGGNPLFDDGASHQRREVDAYRASIGLKGEIGEVAWDTAVTFMDVAVRGETPDIIVNRLQLALRGLGGPDCNPQTGSPGVGSCLWFNPFSNGVARSGATGAANPFYQGGANAALVNDRNVLGWMQQYRVDERTSKLLVGDLVFSGELPLALPGGNVAWAAGGQARRSGESADENELNDINASPCVDSADDGLPGCTGGSGPYTFYGGIAEYDVSRTVYAAFAELNLPVFDSLSLNIAGRYEDYGGNIGSTTNPKVSLRWQALDWLAFRGSAGSTFRAPGQTTVTPGFNRVLAQFTDPISGSSLYRPIDTFNNANLKPETADTVNFGILFEFAGFSASLDYYHFNFKDELTTETGARIYSTMFPSATTNQCNNEELRARFNFANGECAPGNFLGVRANQINGPGVKTSGYDFQAQYRWPDLLGGSLSLGFDGNYLTEYKRGAVQTLEGITIEAATDRAGTLELISQFFSYPEWRGNAFANYGLGSHNFRLDYHYVGGMRDRNHNLGTAAAPNFAATGSYKQFDATYRVALPWDLALTASVQNLTDELPSFAYSQYNYNYTAGNPLGRVYELGVKVKF